MSSASTFVANQDANGPKRPNRRFIKGPDRAAKDARIAELKQEIKEVDYKLSKVYDSINGLKIDDKTAAKRKELQDELNKIIKVQSDFKNQRAQINDKVKLIDASLKKKIGDLNGQTSKIKFKSTQEIDNHIKKLDDAIDSGNLKIVEERRYVKEITALRKLKKDFGQIEASQKQIDADKAKIVELKQQLSGLNSKDIQAKFESITKELDEIRNSTKSVTDKRKSQNDQRNALRKQKDQLYDEMRKVNADYNAAYDKFKKDVAAEKERSRKDEEEYNRQQKKLQREQELKEELENASKPAFQEQISSIKVLAKYFSKILGQPVPEPIAKDDADLAKNLNSLNLNAASSSSNNNNNSSNISVPENYVVLKKEHEVFFQGTKGKKGKKKNHSSSSDNSGKADNEKFILEPDVIVQLSELGLLIPTSRDAVPKLIEELLSQFQTFKTDQDTVTKKNVEAAKAKIAQLEKKYAAEKPEEKENTEEAEN